MATAREVAEKLVSSLCNKIAFMFPIKTYYAVKVQMLNVNLPFSRYSSVLFHFNPFGAKLYARSSAPSHDRDPTAARVHLSHQSHHQHDSHRQHKTKEL